MNAMNENTAEEMYKDALNVSLRYISHRDRTMCEVVNRLEREGYSGEITDRVLSFLKEQGYVNDRRYAEYYIVCYKDKRSIRRILQELKNRGIDDELLDEVMETADADTGMAVRNALKKQMERRGIADMNQASCQEKNKIMAALFRQGYSVEEIRREMEMF